MSSAGMCTGTGTWLCECNSCGSSSTEPLLPPGDCGHGYPATVPFLGGQKPQPGHQPALPAPACPCGVWQSRVNCSIWGKAVGYLVPFATLGAGSSPTVPTCPSKVPALPPTLSQPDVSSPPLLSLSLCPGISWCPAMGPSAALMCVGAADPVQVPGARQRLGHIRAPGPLQSFLEVQAHHRALGTEGHRGCFALLFPPPLPKLLIVSMGAHLGAPWAQQTLIAPQQSLGHE